MGKPSRTLLVTVALVGVAQALLPVPAQTRVSVPQPLEAYARPGPFRVAVEDAQWPDPARHLVIRARIYRPVDAGRHPLVIFSHGLGNSRLGYRYLGEHWASWGITTVHVEHPGAGEDLARRGLIALYRAGFNHDLWRSTVADVRFVLDRVAADAGPIGVAGHSLGAYVAIATAGAIHRADRDARVRAAIALSMSENLPASDYGSTTVPILHFTGTRDSSLLYATTTRMRRIPFESIAAPVADLITIEGANHSTFSADDRSATQPRIDLIKVLTVLWWKAWLEQDAEAQRIWSDKHLGEWLRPIAKLERRGGRPGS